MLFLKLPKPYSNHVTRHLIKLRIIFHQCVDHQIEEKITDYLSLVIILKI